MRGSFGQAHAFEHGERPAAAFGGRLASQYQGHFHVFGGGERRQQVEGLKDEADVGAPIAGKVSGPERRDGPFVHDDLAGLAAFDADDQV